MATEAKGKNMKNVIYAGSNEATKPASPFIPISKLIAKLANFLPPEKICSIKKIEKDLKEKKITRRQMVGHLRSIVHDDYLLASTIKSYNDEETKYAMAAEAQGMNTTGPIRTDEKPTSPFIPLSKLIAKLASCLPREKTCLVKKIEMALKASKITLISLQTIFDC